MPTRCASAGAPTRPALELADIVREHGPALRRRATLTPDQHAVLRAILRCRTAELGGHLDVCLACGDRTPSYNSCRNRHCPKCQSLARARWIEGRMARVLPTHYFHVVFTLPAELRPLAAFHRREVFDLLFAAASATLLELGRDRRRLGADLGITMVLHTWARDLSFHPHVHAIVTGGGFASADDGERWVAARGRYLFPVDVLGALFRGKLLAALDAALARGDITMPGGPTQDPKAWLRLRDRLHRRKWHVYAKRPSGGAEQVIRYLGLYTHRVGISNHRLPSMDARGVTFRTKDGKTVTVSAIAFVRRFFAHVLPRGFVKIRHYGLMAASHATTTLETAWALLSEPMSAMDAPRDAEDASDEHASAPVAVEVLPRCRACGADAILRTPLPQPLARAPPVAA